MVLSVKKRDYRTVTMGVIRHYHTYKFFNLCYYIIEEGRCEFRDSGITKNVLKWNELGVNLWVYWLALNNMIHLHYIIYIISQSVILVI